MNTTTKARINSKERHVGIDVGKSLLDAYIHELDVYWQAENTPAGIKHTRMGDPDILMTNW